MLVEDRLELGDLAVARGASALPSGDIECLDRIFRAELVHNQAQCVSLTIFTSPDVVNSMLIIQTRFSRP
jgi:hypothetical protein